LNAGTPEDVQSPQNLQPPTISPATPQQGVIAAANSGVWSNDPSVYFYQWLACSATGESCEMIADATGSTYTPVPGDAGHALVVDVTAAAASGSGIPTASAATSPVVEAPSNLKMPALSTSNPTEGVLLSTTNGTWAGFPAPGFTYQWQRCNAFGGECAKIANATSPSYRPVAADVGHTIQVAVSASDSLGVATAVTFASNIVTGGPIDTLAPSLSTSAPVAGTSLSVSNGTWSGYPTPTYSYQWEDCESSGASCTTIAGANSSSYTPTSADVAHTLKAVLSATNATGSASASTAASHVVIAVASPPTNLTAPKLSNSTAQQGTAETVTAGSWTNSPTSYGYQWQRCNASGGECADIGGATASTYTPVAADVARTLKAVVTAHNAGGEGAAETSVSNAVVPQSVLLPPAPTETTAPALASSQPRQGQSDSVSNGVWANNPVSYHYQWQDCEASGNECVNINGATISSYTPVAADVGETIRAIVTARNAGGEGSAESSISGVVTAAAPVNTVAPSLSPASPHQSIAETVSPGSWTNNPSSYTYQWEDCNASDEECSDIDGATSATYTPVAADVGHMLVVAVTALNDGVSGSASSGNSGRLVVSPSAQSFYSPNAGASFSGPESVWNTPVMNDSEFDPSSESLVETLANWGAHSMNGINTTSYSSPIYTVPAGQPAVPVVLDYQSPPLNAALQSVPIPQGARPAAGTDGTLVVYQPSSNQMWEFWRLRESLIAPVEGTFTAAVSSGGGLAAGTYYYAVTALSAAGETTPSEALKVVVPQSESKVSLSFKGVIDAQGYKIYRGTEATNVGYIGTVNQATEAYGTTVTYVDAAGTPGSAPPSVDRASTPGQWHASWAGRIQDVSADPGYYRLVHSGEGTVSEEPTWGSTASSLPVADGMITLQDLSQGHIDHALQLLVPTSRATVHSYPAQRTDGAATGPASIPEGAHFILDSSVNCNEQATPFMRMVCVAAQRYGLIVSDQTHGGMALRGEDPTPLMQTGGQNPYPAYFTDGTGKQWQPYQMMAAFPWAHLHLLPMQLENQNQFHP
jgi:hypothetical protein